MKTEESDGLTSRLQEMMMRRRKVTSSESQCMCSRLISSVTWLARARGTGARAPGSLLPLEGLERVWEARLEALAPHPVLPTQRPHELGPLRPELAWGHTSRTRAHCLSNSNSYGCGGRSWDGS
jgi:hypothetical protein